MVINQHELITRIQYSMSAIQTAALYGMVKTACFDVDKGQDILLDGNAPYRAVVSTSQDLITSINWLILLSDDFRFIVLL